MHFNAAFVINLFSECNSCECKGCEKHCNRSYTMIIDQPTCFCDPGERPQSDDNTKCVAGLKF